MATGSTTSSFPALTYTTENWLDLEVPGEIIDDNWSDDDQRGIARTRASTQSISMGALKVAWKQVRDQSDRDKVKQSKEDTFDLIDDLDSDVLKCMYASYLFSRGTKERYISHFYNQLVGSIHPEYDELYNKLNSKNRKVGKTMFLYLYDPDALKGIFTLDHIDQRKPREIGQSTTSIGNPLDNVSTDRLEETAKSDKRSAKHWHSFEYKNNPYITIKRHYRDAVNPQTTKNEEVEEAEYVVTKFDGDTVDIHTEKKGTANTIRDSLGSAHSNPDVEFEPAEERKPPDHFEDTTPLEITNKIDGKKGYTVTGILTEDTKFSKNPTLKLYTDDKDAVLPAIRDLRDVNDKFFTEIRNINHFIIAKNNTTYTLLPKQEDSGDFQWFVRYQARGASDAERKEFEKDIGSILNITPCFISSD